VTREEYAELVEYIEDRWGTVDSWANAHRLVDDFDSLPADLVWEILLQRLTGDEEKAKWPPRPAELIAGTRARIRQQPTPALPETTEKYPWAEFLKRYYNGETLTSSEAMIRKSDELSRGR
jgi:hypothetical protein